MRASRVVAVSLVLALGAGPALGDITLQGRGVVTGGATDNVTSAPEDPPPGVPGPRRDVFLEARPSLVMWSFHPRSLFIAMLSLSWVMHLEQSQADTFSQVLGLNSVYDLSARSMLRLGLDATHGRSYGAALIEPVAPMPGGLVPTGDVEYIQSSLTEGFIHEISDSLGFNQSGLLQVFKPLDTGDPADVDGAFALTLSNTTQLEKRYLRDRFRADHMIMMNQFARTDVTDRQLANELAVSWLHDLSLSWETELRLGAGMVSPLDFSDFGFYPAARAAIRFTREGTAALTAFHGVSVSLPAAQTFITDAVTLNAGFSLIEEKLFVDGSVGLMYQRTLQELEDSEISTSAKSMYAGLGVMWQVTPGVSAIASAQHQRQEVDLMMAGLAPSMIRNTVLVSIIATYPTVVAGVRPFMSPADVTRERIREAQEDPGFDRRAEPLPGEGEGGRRREQRRGGGGTGGNSGGGSEPR